MTDPGLYACAVCGPWYDDEGGGKSCVNCGTFQEGTMGTDQRGITVEDCEAGHERGRCDGAPYCYKCVAEKKKAATEKAKEENGMDISKYDKAEILAALYNGSHQQGSGFLNASGRNQMTVDEARTILMETTYFDYLGGRVMKIDLSGDELSTRLYNRDCGEGAAERIIATLKAKEASDAET